MAMQLNRSLATPEVALAQVRQVDNTKIAYDVLGPSSSLVVAGKVDGVLNGVSLIFTAEADAADRTGNAAVWLMRQDNAGMVPMLVLMTLNITFGATLTASGGLITASTRPGYLVTLATAASGFIDYNIVNPFAVGSNPANEQFSVVTFNPNGAMVAVDLLPGTGVTDMQCLAATF